MKPKYTLSTSNKVYLGIVLLITILLSFLLPELTPYRPGQLVGQSLTAIVTAALLAWIIWRLSGRKQKGRSITFNVILTLSLLGQIGQFSRQFTQSDQLREIQHQKQRFKNAIIHAKTEEEANAASSKLAEYFSSTLESLYESSTGTEKRFYGIMKEITAKNLVISQNWSESFDTILSPRILDCALLNNDKEFEYQIGVCRQYVEKAKALQQSTVNVVQNMKNQLSTLGPNNELANGEIRLVKEKYDSLEPIIEPLMQAYVSYGEAMVMILEFLQEHRHDWTYENDELIIYNDSLLDRYNELYEILSKNETTISEIGPKLFKVY